MCVFSVMRALWNDSRLFLWMLADDGVEAAGAQLAELWQRCSRKGRLDRVLRKLEAEGLVNRTGEGPLDERLFRLTAAGRGALDGSVDPESLWKRSWDGKWRLVLFDVPQSKAAVRTHLRRRLQELRFGWLQNSVWLSPDPADELVQLFAAHRATVESLVFLEARPCGGESDEELVTGAWDFDRLARVHAEYLQVMRLRPGRSRRGEVSAWVAWAQSEQRAWDQVLRLDPFLPEALWPRDYAGREVWLARREAMRAGSEALLRASAAD